MEANALNTIEHHIEFMRLIILLMFVIHETRWVREWHWKHVACFEHVSFCAPGSVR